MIKVYTGSAVISNVLTYKVTVRGDDDRVISSGTSTVSLRLATQQALKRLKTMYDTAVTQAVNARLIATSTDLG